MATGNTTKTWRGHNWNVLVKKNSKAKTQKFVTVWAWSEAEAVEKAVKMSGWTTVISATKC